MGGGIVRETTVAADVAKRTLASLAEAEELLRDTGLWPEIQGTITASVRRLLSAKG